MSIKSRIKEAIKRKAPEGQLDKKYEFKASGTGDQYTVKSSGPRTGSEETPLSPEQEAEIQGIKESLKREWAKTEDPTKPGHFKERELTDEEKRALDRVARKQASRQSRMMEQEIEEEARLQEAGVPKTEWRKGWEKKPGEKKSSEVWREVRVPRYQRRIIAAQVPMAEAQFGLGAQRAQQEMATGQVLHPVELQTALGYAQDESMQAEFERSRLAPVARSAQDWEAQKVLERIKKEQFARTKKGKAMRIAGKGFDKAAEGFAGGLGNAALGMGMALRSGPSVDTAIYTGRFNPRNVNMQTPASQVLGQTWGPSGRALLPSNRMPAGVALGRTSSPAGMAMLPNLRGLNPAITVNPMGPGIPGSRLSPLPRRRVQPQPQAQRPTPGTSRIG